MTRLKTEWIADIEKQAADWNRKLQQQTGLDYLELAARVSGNSRRSLEQAAERCRIGVVPITSGLGTIDTFSQSVAAIVRVMGFETFVTGACDVDGIYEACRGGADILYMADDDRYLALNIQNGRTGDNNLATARGFAELLCSMAGGLKKQQTAVLGYGIIGQLMAQALTEKGAELAVYDKDPAKESQVLADGYRWIGSAGELKKFRYIADATSQGPWLEADMLHSDVILAAPGIPFSLSEAAKHTLEGRYIHDLLEIGTASMLGLAI